MDLNEYQEKAMVTAIYGNGAVINYPILGLVGEAGEIANKYKKVLRDTGGEMSEQQRYDLSKELGDVLWYCAALARDLGTTLNTVAENNLSKLAQRHATGTIQGSGDDREKNAAVCTTGSPVNYTTSRTDELNYQVDVPANSRN